MAFTLNQMYAIIRGVTTNEGSGVLQGVTFEEVGAVLQGVINSTRPAIIKGKPHSDRGAGVFAAISSTRKGITEGKPYSNRNAILSPKATQDIYGIMQAVTFDEGKGIIYGKITNDRYAILRGVTYNTRNAIIKGIEVSDRNGIIKGLPYTESPAIIHGVTFSLRDALIKGKPYDERLGILEGKPYSDRNAVVSGYIYEKYLNLQYSVTNLFSLIMPPSAHSYIDRTYANLEEYEQGVETLYTYFGRGRLVYEYNAVTKTLTPLPVDRPFDAEWSIEVYGEDINDRDFRRNIIDHLTERDFDAEMRKALRRTIDDKYMEFNISIGVSGSYSKVHCIMRVKGTSEVPGVIMGRPYPVYLLGTDFGLFVFITGRRWYHRPSNRGGVIRGKWISHPYYWGILHGVTFNERPGITEGKPYSDIPGIAKGKPYNDIGGGVQAIVYSMRYAITLGKPYSERPGILKGKPYDGLNGILPGVAWNDIPGITLGKAYSERPGITLGKPYDDINGVVPSVVWDIRKAIMAGKPYSERPGIIFGKPYDDIGGVTPGVAWDIRRAITFGKPYSERPAISKGKPYNDLNGVAPGVAWDIRKAIAYGKHYNEREAVAQGEHILGQQFVIASGTEHVSIPRNIRAITNDAFDVVYAAYEFDIISGTLTGTKISSSTDKGEIWSLHTTVSGSGHNIFPSVATDINRDLHLVWQSRDSSSGTYNVLYNFYDYSGSSWAGLEYVSVSGADYDNVYPALAMDGNDDAYIAWCSASGVSGTSSSGVYNIWLRRKNVASGTWEAIEYITTSGGQYNPAIACTASTTGTTYVHISWFGYWGNASGTSIQYVRGET